MELPRTLQNRIIDFLKSLPNLEEPKSQRAFIYSAGLDQQLQDQIPFGEPLAQFVPLLVSKLIKYGKLKDNGQYALEAVLEASKNYIGQDRIVYCESLLEELRAILQEQLQFGLHSKENPETFTAKIVQRIVATKRDKQIAFWVISILLIALLIWIIIQVFYLPNRNKEQTITKRDGNLTPLSERTDESLSSEEEIVRNFRLKPVRNIVWVIQLIHDVDSGSFPSDIDFYLRAFIRYDKLYNETYWEELVVLQV